MSKYLIACDSAADLSEDFYQANNVKTLAYSYCIDGQEYFDDLKERDKHYELIEKCKSATSSQINFQRYFDFFEELLQEKQDILYITMSSGLSGSYSNALKAAEELNETNTNKVYVIDSVTASCSMGIIVSRACVNRDNNFNILDNVKDLEANKMKSNIFFESASLESYIKGGRISKVKGYAGKLLSICPVLTLDKQGSIAFANKVRTKKKAMLELIKNMEANAKDGLNYCLDVFISHTACLNDALELKQMVVEKFKNVSNIFVNTLTPVIGLHTGVNSLGIFFIGKER